MIVLSVIATLTIFIVIGQCKAVPPRQAVKTSHYKIEDAPAATAVLTDGHELVKRATSETCGYIRGSIGVSRPMPTC